MQLSATELKDRVSLKSLFERDDHELKRAAPDTWKCRCPFHAEKTASCVVHDEKGFFKCFGCNARGTIFEYWALARGIDGKSKEGFAEICRQLSELVLGHAVPPPKARPATEVKEPERPAPLAGRDLERWREGCRWLAENEEAQAKLAEWRGYRVSLVKQLAEQGKIGMPVYFGARLPAFAVECVDEKSGRAVSRGLPRAARTEGGREAGDVALRSQGHRLVAVRGRRSAQVCVSRDPRRAMGCAGLHRRAGSRARRLGTWR